MIRVLLAVLACLVTASTLGGCRSLFSEPPLPPAIVTVVRAQPPPIPPQCRAQNLKRFPRLVETGSASMPPPAPAAATPADGDDGIDESVLEDKWLEAKFVHRVNRTQFDICECWLVDVAGTDQDKAEAAPRCASLRKGAATP
jgi:hypothetical protein